MAKALITWKVRGAIKLYDSFTGRPVKLPGIRVVTDEEVSVLQKGEGVLVFAGNKAGGEKPLRVRMESQAFLTEEILLPAKASADLFCLWLWPDKKYPVPASATKMYGRARPGAWMGFVFAEEIPEMRLSDDLGTDSQRAEICHPGKRSLEGRLLEIRRENARNWVKIGRRVGGSRMETGIYEFSFLGEKGEKTYPRKGTILRMGYVSRADEDGNFIFFFRNTPRESFAGRVYFRDGDREICREVQGVRGGSTAVEGWDTII